MQIIVVQMVAYKRRLKGHMYTQTNQPRASRVVTGAERFNGQSIAMGWTVRKHFKMLLLRSA